MAHMGGWGGGWLPPTYAINLPYRYGLVGDKMEDEKSSKTTDVLQNYATALFDLNLLTQPGHFRGCVDLLHPSHLLVSHQQSRSNTTD